MKGPYYNYFHYLVAPINGRFYQKQLQPLMRLKLLRLIIVVGCLVFFSGSLKPQSCIPTNINGTTINLLCNQVCTTMVFQVPHVKSTADYNLSTVPYNPYPYSTPTGSEDPVLYADDRYSGLINLPFPFCFYDSVFNSGVVGSNGILTFEQAVANCANAYVISSPIPFGGTFSCGSISPAYYPRSSIMPAFSDLDPRTSPAASPPDRKIQWEVVGTAPCRKFVVSYYHIGVFGITTGSCGIPQNTFQIVLHESTGIIDLYFEQKACNSTTNAGRGVFGIQNWLRDKWVSMPGKNNAVWTENNTGYRFTPSGGASRFVSSELYDLLGNLIMPADTLTTVAGLLDIRFPNFCPPAGTNQYVVKTIFSACDNPANQLISYDTITVDRLNSLGATAVKTDATCGPPNGTITVTVPPGVGTPPYTFVLDGGAPVTGSSPYTFTNVAAGPHTVVVSDATAGCTSTINITVNLVGNIPATTTNTPTACSGVNNGTITITSAGGAGPYTFSLDGGAPVAGTIPYTFTNLAPGVHTLLVTDISTGCTSVLMSITITTGAGVTATSSTTPATCLTVNNGTITVTATAGTAPFTWQLDAAPVVTGASPYTFTGVAPGLHTVIVTDAVGCTRTLSVNVTAGPGISATLSSTPTACVGVGNGSITINATTGTAPYTYSLDGGAPQSGANPYTFINVGAGLHTVLVTDANGCTFTSNVNVTAGPGVNGTANTTATSCPTATDGSITVSATAGTAPFTWQLDAAPPVAGASPYTFTNVAAGAHTIIITDVFGCNLTLNANVAAGPPLDATTSSNATSCVGATNGTITVTPTNGTAPYQYSLNGGALVAGGASYTFTNVPPGVHTVTVTDAAGCVTTAIPVTVVAGPQLVTTATSVDVLCNGGATGSITVAVPVIGSPPYQYSLDNITWQASNIFNGLAAGAYTVYFREANGCQGSLNITVNEPAALSSSAATVAAVCNGQNNGTITITAGGGVGPYEYSIDGGATWQTGNIFTVGAGNYTIIIRDINGCTRTQSATVTEPAALTASSVNSNASCDGGNDGVITVNAAGGNTSYTYSIDGVNFQASNVFNVAPGNYTVTVTDNFGCTTTFNTVVGLTNNLTVTPQTDPTICESKSVQLNLASNATVYSWSPATGLSNTTINNPVANPIVTTQYIVTATLGRCSANDTVMVNVNTAPIPDAGPDGFICYGQTYQLQGNGGVQYTWTPNTYLNADNIPNPVSTPAKTITYTLAKVIDAFGCESLTTDNVTIDVTPPIKVRTYPFDTIAYPGDQFMLNVTTNTPGIINYVWTPSVGLSNPNIANPVLTVGPIGSDVLYQVITSTVAGCKGEGYVKLRVYKGPELYTPSAFTPNGDGLNDKFYPFPVGIKSINYFRVFNRWGQLVYSTTTLLAGWDGKMQGVEQPSGTYVFMAEGLDKNNKKITKKGTVTLIR